MQIVWTADALNDLQDIRDYIRTENPKAANKVAWLILEGAKSLRTQPHRGRHGALPDTRELILTKIPYRIVYRVKMQQVQILKVFHHRQDEWKQ